MNPPRIAVLSPELADQIAAGEVVERPASVVKELAENALDAGARRIEVEIERGGLQLVRITDDGSGMTPEEAHLCLKRHATSKLRTAEDLFALQTMGFRGEALPSIAAVSRMTLTTRTAEAVAAYRLTVEAGREVGPGREAGASVGTQIEVRDLLHNVPARLKFMKGEATEAGHVVEALVRLALAHPAVHFKLKQNGKGVLDLPPHGTGLARAQAALGSRGRGAGPAVLHPAQGVESEIEVEAHMGAPADGASTPRNVYLLVNRRFIRDRSLLHAAAMGYGELLEKGRYPLLVLHVRMAGEAVDVNVHPQKLEVRFARPQEVYAAVRHVMHKTAQRAPWLLGGPAPGPARVYRIDGGMAASPAAEARADYGGLPGGASSGGRPAVRGPGPDDGGAGLAEHRSRLQQALDLHGPIRSDVPKEVPSSGPGAGPASAPAPASAERPPPGAVHEFFSTMSYLGQLHRTYLLCEHQGELILIDQHAAHERLAFERLRAGYAQHAIRSQRLLFPLTLDLDPGRAAVVEEQGDVLVGMGFELRPFGGRSFALSAVPDAAEFGRGARVYQDPERLLGKVLDDLQAHGTSDEVLARTELVLATIACHSVVRAGDALDAVRARALLQAMDEVEFCPHCPHGRPVMVRMPRAEIEKRFGRS